MKYRPVSAEEFERTVLLRPGAEERVAELEQQLLVAHALRRARKAARVSQKELARRMGVSQPRIAAIERAEDLNVSTLLRYIRSLGGEPNLEIVVGDTHIRLLPDTQHLAEPA